MPEPDLPLAGVNVLELAAGVAGRYCGRLLAGYGAHVTRIEASTTTPGTAPDPRRLMLDADKRSAVLPDGDPQALTVLIARADIVVTDQEWAQASAADPVQLFREHADASAVLTRVTPFGDDGPYAHWRGDDFTLAALAGWTFTQGDPERAPVWIGGPYISYIAGAHAAFGAVTARLHAEATGQGQEVNLTGLEVAATAMLYDHVGYAYTGNSRRRKGNILGAPWLALPVADGHVGLSGLPNWEEFWMIMLETADVPQNPWLVDTQDERVAITDEIHKRLAGMPKRHFFELGQTLRALTAELLSPEEVLTSPQYAARDYFVSPEDDATGLRHPGAPSRLSQTPWRMRHGAVPPGHDTAAVLAELAAPAPTSGDAQATADKTDTKRPYDGLLVVDFTMGWAGPSVTQMLADHGAKVIKVESTTHADWWRTSRQIFVEGPEDLDHAWEWSPLFNAVNENKLGITLDLNQSAGLKLARALIARADVVVENYTPRVMRHFGLDYEAVRALNPDVVMVSMPAFGSSGPWADYKATAFITESAAGISWLSGEPDEPMLSSSAVADPNAGAIGALSVAAALRARRVLGIGQHIEVAQVEALTPLIGEALLRTQLGDRPTRLGNRASDFAPRGVFPAAGDDRWVSLSVESDEQWAAAAEVLGIGGESRWSSGEQRLADQDELERTIATQTAQYDAHDLAARLQAVGVAAAAVQDAEQVLADPQLAHSSFFRQVERPISGTHPYPGPPLHLSATPARRSRPAPTLGQHSEEVLSDALGLTADELAHLAEAGVIGTEPRLTRWE